MSIPLRDADLRGADFSGAKLRGADLTGAQLEGAVIDLLPIFPGAQPKVDTLPRTAAEPSPDPTTLPRAEDADS